MVCNQQLNMPFKAASLMIDQYSDRLSSRLNILSERGKLVKEGIEGFAVEEEFAVL